MGLRLGIIIAHLGYTRLVKVAELYLKILRFVYLVNKAFISPTNFISKKSKDLFSRFP